MIPLTARSRKEDRERCLKPGMDDFLTKPISVSELLGAIDRLEEARPLVAKLETICTELTRVVAGRSIKELQRLAGWTGPSTEHEVKTE